MKKLLNRIILVSLLFIPSISFADFSDVTITTSAVIQVGAYSLNVIGSSAAVQSITVNLTNFAVTLASGSSITISSPGLNQLSTDVQSDVTSNPCTPVTSSLSLAYSGAGNVTNTITPSSVSCAGTSSFRMDYLSTDGNGVKSYNITSDYNAGGTVVLRVLEPNNPTPGVAHNFLYALPVDPWGISTFGDGLDTLRALNAQNQYNVTIIEPSFVTYPWYADSDNNSDYRYESFMTLELQPWAQTNLSTSGTEQNWLLGFSKSGYGGLDLLLKHPNLFTLGAFWDFPSDMTDYTSYSANTNYGTQPNFANNYELTSTLVGNYKTPFLSDNRIWISGYYYFQQDVSDFDTILSSQGVQHTTATGISSVHSWGSGWVVPAVAALYADSTVAPSITSISSSNISFNSATIVWSTNLDSSSRVDYGTSPGLYNHSSTEIDISTRVTNHSVILPSLLPNTTYYYRVKSKNYILNETVSTEKSFTTAASSLGGSSSGSSISPFTLATILAPSASTTAYLKSLAIHACPANYICTPIPDHIPTVPTTPSIPSTTFTRDLTIGSQGSDVITLQNYLIRGGYLAAGYNTGYFGSLTQSALAKYQVAHNITPASGYYGPVTILSLSNGTPQMSTPFVVSLSSFTRNLDVGSKGTDVKMLQVYLNTYGFTIASSGSASPGNETDYFGRATQAALIKFQVAHSITPAVGYFGPITRKVVGQ